MYGSAHAGIAGNALEVTRASVSASNHSEAFGRWPPPKMAPRSFIDSAKTTASGWARRRASATVSTRMTAADELARSRAPSAVTSFVLRSKSELTAVPSGSSLAFARTPDSRAAAPLNSAA